MKREGSCRARMLSISDLGVFFNDRRAFGINNVLTLSFQIEFISVLLKSHFERSHGIFDGLAPFHQFRGNIDHQLPGL